MRRLLLLAIALMLLVVLPNVARQDLAVAQPHGNFIDKQIYAYRDWQSTGIPIDQGDLVEISAEGTWSYTPDEFHGPAGHPILRAPAFYPLANVAGGTLLGRVGEDGPVFAVGAWSRFPAHEHGVLYLRIDDDVLSDNVGAVTVQIQVTETDETVP